MNRVRRLLGLPQLDASRTSTWVVAVPLVIGAAFVASMTGYATTVASPGGACDDADDCEAVVGDDGSGGSWEPFSEEGELVIAADEGSEESSFWTSKDGESSDAWFVEGEGDEDGESGFWVSKPPDDVEAYVLESNAGDDWNKRVVVKKMLPRHDGESDGEREGVIVLTTPDGHELHAREGMAVFSSKEEHDKKHAGAPPTARFKVFSPKDGPKLFTVPRAKTESKDDCDSCTDGKRIIVKRRSSDGDSGEPHVRVFTHSPSKGDKTAPHAKLFVTPKVKGGEWSSDRFFAAPRVKVPGGEGRVKILTPDNKGAKILRFKNEDDDEKSEGKKTKSKSKVKVVKPKSFAFDLEAPHQFGMKLDKPGAFAYSFPKPQQFEFDLKTPKQFGFKLEQPGQFGYKFEMPKGALKLDQPNLFQYKIEKPKGSAGSKRKTVVV